MKTTIDSVSKSCCPSYHDQACVIPFFFTGVDAFQRKYRIGVKRTGIQVHKTAKGNKGRGVQVRETPLGASIWVPVFFAVYR
ncbi:MAG: hypothetical protein BWY09_02666 [Candidatus Hydrogenedentes bacterium ADurb.Bin179]|nr:MAG: hypothetical protein BWY09_02666 [Candidatus Hydrogenedentes bacterium ADurb.Bin179]